MCPTDKFIAYWWEAISFDYKNHIKKASIEKIANKYETHTILGNLVFRAMPSVG